MSSVYRTLSKSSGKEVDSEDKSNGAGMKKNKQRVLILSSRGVTYRYGDSDLITKGLTLC